MVLIEGDSKITVPKFLNDNPTIMFDFVEIDGDHTYEGAKTDTHNFMDKINKNGIIYIDDYISVMKGVWNFVNEESWDGFEPHKGTHQVFYAKKL